MNRLLVMVPREGVDRLRAAGSHGSATFRVSDAENVGYLCAVSVKEGLTLPVKMRPRTHFLNVGEARRGGFWYRATTDLHAYGMAAGHRQSALTVAYFAEQVRSGFKNPGRSDYIALTYAPDVEADYPGAGIAEFAAWLVTADGVEPLDVACEPQVVGNAQLAPQWPVDPLAAATVTVVGTGSIGGATVHALADYGVGRLVLVDPDRLLWHNLVRHVSGPAQVGKMKVFALRDDLEKLRPDTHIEPHALDVIRDADKVRPLLARSDLVVCTADGVAPRRVVSHLARRAGLEAVLACVLEDGGIGEILRLRPWPDRGCLVCQRQALTDAGAIDPEPALDAGYGTGTRHRPMTAVGSDLHLVGQLAAKAAVATLLECAGHPDQRLPGDHGLLALRPKPGWPPPFDLARAGELRWLAARPPVSGCPTCEEP
ncbi:Molybdopterin or thiamine biosynthesis adenylyltransferase [Micromonospora viridifaciens]|uniref:Molybdopterin or thiamine biosynthesis adenylyltransferase n=2 Tax=Micromonospora viridifaciens TaxID=1881 RepID=A0A1C4WFT3_MICVI|nr:Molybdopterin or thiamine biosynthesis adenylyltransferase [Micromonospora viridifaciens]